jgi:hypothetical protein
MWRQKAAGITALALGVILLIAGIIDHEIVAPKSALCQSGIGQIGQALDDTVAHDCGLVTTLESAVGWLLAIGALALILGAVILYNSRSAPQPAPARLYAPHQPPPPYQPPASYPPPAPRPDPPGRSTPPADPPWWPRP